MACSSLAERRRWIEGVVLEDLLADFAPDIFLWVELRRVRRKEQERDVVGEHEVATPVVGSAVENQKNMGPGEFS